ncbi:MAG: hypothetical protein KKF46_05135 [Nanoarchaeota archaeon]|nr:hypothetical protein [Nanoarchaeota archaeon]MBU1321718.1 hypothetical protein [Nanoarchaeota archaeon]MBU1597684.1 hypothetical protein [Nanoarchaeota archaeon]
MVYAVDFVLNVMKELSSTEPVLFQRDGLLYIASEQGFGQVTYGLRTRPEEIQSWENRGQSPEIAESEDAIHKWVGDKYNKKPDFKKGEKPYLKAICFGPDDNSFTLEEITKGAQELAKLKDDGKIRMVLHRSGYHSHKYGYAADGIDVWVQEARVMDRERYLEIIREKEDKIINRVEGIENVGERRDVGESYERLTFPDCVILTPNIMVGLPRSGRLHLHRDELDSWIKSTRLSINYSGSTKGSILYHQDMDTYDESPFGVSVKLNAKVLNASDVKEFDSKRQYLIERISKELIAVNSNMALAEEYVARLNAIHNKICAPNIEWSKDLRKDMKARATA